MSTSDQSEGAEYYYMQDFTLSNYAEIIKQAKACYKFIGYQDYKTTEASNIVLWRHDIDFSPHRAYRLAEIESAENVGAAYFVNLHSEFYNLLEYEVYNIIKRISNMGHHIGLHFDPCFYNITSDDYENLEYWVKTERDILEKVFEVNISAVSFHNPTIGGFDSLRNEKISGLINTYSDYFKNEYEYCSDSNGYCRFKRLQDALEECKNNRLQVLTHPAWWTDDALKPFDRIKRAVDGRADKTIYKYKELIRGCNRKLGD